MIIHLFIINNTRFYQLFIKAVTDTDTTNLKIFTK